MKFVIRYKPIGKQAATYYRGPTPIGPAFGASKAESPRFESRLAVVDVVRHFPPMVDYEVEEVEA